MLNWMFRSPDPPLHLLHHHVNSSDSFVVTLGRTHSVMYWGLAQRLKVSPPRLPHVSRPYRYRTPTLSSSVSSSSCSYSPVLILNATASQFGLRKLSFFNSSASVQSPLSHFFVNTLLSRFGSFIAHYVFRVRPLRNLFKEGGI